MFNNIPQQRLVLYLVIAGLVPIILVWFSFSSSLSTVSSIESQMYRLQDMAFNREKKQAINMAVRNHYREADHFYIDKNLESLTLLQSEVESLKSILDDPKFPEDENVKKRLELLAGPGNTLVFTEGVVQATPIFQEVTETLAHPVEVNIADLQQILCRIEGIAIGECKPPQHRPQLLILDFKMEKKNVSEKNQVFSLNLKLLKREFL